MNSEAYRRDFDEIKALGGVDSHPAAASCPAPRNTDVARFYSGNHITQWHDTVRQIALDRQLSISESARLLALAGMAIGDSFIAVWDSKYHYNYWRPVTAVREGDNDTNDATVGVANWTPFIQSSHFVAGNPTPPYPDYVSGANGLAGAATSILQLYFRTDSFQFEVYKATPPSVVVCENPRPYKRFSQVQKDVIDARILLGIHFRTADEQGRNLGARVALWTFFKYLRPRHY